MHGVSVRCKGGNVDNFYVEIEGQCNVDCNSLTAWTDSTANIDWNEFYRWRQPYYDYTVPYQPFDYE